MCPCGSCPLLHGMHYTLLLVSQPVVHHLGVCLLVCSLDGYNVWAGRAGTIYLQNSVCIIQLFVEDGGQIAYQISSFAAVVQPLFDGLSRPCILHSISFYIVLCAPPDCTYVCVAALCTYIPLCMYWYVWSCYVRTGSYMCPLVFTCVRGCAVGVVAGNEPAHHISWAAADIQIIYGIRVAFISLMRWAWPCLFVV